MLIWRALLFVAMVAQGVCAASQEPSPSPPVVAAQKHPKEVKPQQQSTPAPQGTNENPVVVKSIEAEKTPERRAQEREDGKEKERADAQLVQWTWILAIATIALAGLTLVVATIAGGQLAMFWKQLGLMKIGIADTKTAADAAKASADLAHKEFIAAHRPRMIVRRLSWIRDAADSHIGVSYAIKNVGDGPGTVIAISAMIWKASSRANLSSLPAYPAAQQANIPLKRGDWIDSRHTMDNGLINDVALLVGYENVRQADPQPNILFLGYIDYIDSEGRKLQTGFLRRFDFEVERFEPIPNPDYEYQD